MIHPNLDHSSDRLIAAGATTITQGLNKINNYPKMLAEIPSEI